LRFIVLLARKNLVTRRPMQHEISAGASYKIIVSPVFPEAFLRKIIGFIANGGNL